mgnify:CR=1 FL=1
MLQMVKEVLANLSILISSAYLLSKISKTLLPHQSPLIHKLVMGLGSGITGIILMNFSISYQDSFLIDIRLVPLVMASFLWTFTTDYWNLSHLLFNRVKPIFY